MKIIEVTSNTITRPNDSTDYADTDLVANSTTAGSVTPFTFRLPYGRGLKLWKANLLKSSTLATNTSFRLHLYKDSPTCSNGDNGAWLTTVSGYQGFITLSGTATTFSDDHLSTGTFITSSVFAPMLLVADVDQRIYGLLEAKAAYDPTALETFTATLIGEAYV